MGVGVLEGLRQIECLCIDDIDRVVGGRDWEHALFGVLQGRCSCLAWKLVQELIERMGAFKIIEKVPKGHCCKLVGDQLPILFGSASRRRRFPKL